MTDSLFSLCNDPKFMELLQDSRSFSEMTNHLKAKHEVSLHLLLCSSTRCFLAAICRRLAHLHTIANRVMQYWEGRPPTNSTDSHGSTSRSLYQAYLKLHRCITTNLIKIEEFDKLLSSVGADIRQTYQTSLANLAQKQQQQQQSQPLKPGQPNPAEQAIKKAQAHCELMILLGDQPPPSFQSLVKKFFETDLRNLMSSTNRSELFFTDFPLLEVEDDVKRLATRKAQGRYVDVFRKIEHKEPTLVKGSTNSGDFNDSKLQQQPSQELQQNGEVSGSEHPAFRRCVRCCGVMEDVVATRPGYNFLVAQQRKCSCGGSWASLP